MFDYEHRDKNWEVLKKANASAPQGYVRTACARLWDVNEDLRKVLLEHLKPITNSLNHKPYTVSAQNP